MTAIQYDKQLQKIIKESEPKKSVTYAVAGYTGLRVRIKGGRAEIQHRYTHPILKNRVEMTLGIYPNITLEQARQLYKDNLALLAQNIDPKPKES